MLVARQTKPDDGLSPDTVLAKAGFDLTTSEIARRVGISEEAARALVKEAFSLESRAAEKVSYSIS